MSKTEKMTERVTVKMDANLKAKLKREAERCGGDMSAYIRSLIENRLPQAAGNIDRKIGGTDAQMPAVKPITRAEHKHARKRNVRADRATSRADTEKDP